MGGFEIWAVGEGFNADDYLAGSDLQFDEVWRNGLHHIVDQRGVVNVAFGPSLWLMFECLRAGVSPIFYVDLERAVVGGRHAQSTRRDH